MDKDTQQSLIERGFASCGYCVSAIFYLFPGL